MTEGESFIKEGKPVTFQNFDPLKLQTNAEVFQYKGGGNAQEFHSMSGAHPL